MAEIRCAGLHRAMFYSRAAARAYLILPTGLTRKCRAVLNWLCLVLCGSILLKRHHTCPKQFYIGAAVHGAFQHLKTADLGFQMAVAPRFNNRVANGTDILLPAAGKALHAVNATVTNLVHPNIELL